MGIRRRRDFGGVGRGRYFGHGPFRMGSIEGICAEILLAAPGAQVRSQGVWGLRDGALVSVFAASFRLRALQEV